MKSTVREKRKRKKRKRREAGAAAELVVVIGEDVAATIGEKETSLGSLVSERNRNWLEITVNGVQRSSYSCSSLGRLIFARRSAPPAAVVTPTTNRRAATPASVPARRWSGPVTVSRVSGRRTTT